MAGPASETAKPSAGFQFNPHRKSHLRSHTFSTLLRILSHCRQHSHCSHDGPVPDYDSSCVERLTDNEVGNELVAADNLEPEDTSIQEEPIILETLDGMPARDDPIVNESAEVIGFQEVGSSNVQVIIDDLEQIMRGEGNDHAVAGKSNSSLILSFEDDQNNTASERLMAKKEDSGADVRESTNLFTSALDKDQNADDIDKWINNNADLFDLQHVILQEEEHGEQVKASNEQNNFEILEGLNLSVDDDINGEDSKPDENKNEKDSPLKGIAMENLGFKVQQTEMELKKSVCPVTASSPLQMAVDGDIEEGEISGDFIDDYLLIKDDEAAEMKGEEENISENIINKEVFACNEQKRVNNKDSESTTKIIHSAYKVNNGVKGKKSKRKQKKSKSKIGQGGRTINGARRTDGSYPSTEAETSRMKGRAAKWDFDSPSNFLEDLAFREEGVDKNAAQNLSITSVKEGTEVTKKRKRELAEERRAKNKVPCVDLKKNKQKEKQKKTEKNRGPGVKRLKLLPESKPKTVAYCRHYLKGKCQKGAECIFSHDTIPLTKSKPCYHLAHGNCMKGDDCQYDHQLSKYPCDNYVSKGFCSRGDACLFSHKMPLKEGSASACNTFKPVLDPSSLPSKVDNHKNIGELQNMNEKAKRDTVAVPPRGINFLSSGKASSNDSSFKELVGSPSNREDGKKISESGDSNKYKQVVSSSTRGGNINLGNQLNQSATETIHKLNDMSNRRQPAVVPRGINFQSFNKASLDDISSRRQSKSPSQIDSLIETSVQERQRASSGFQNSNAVPWRLPASTITPVSDQLVHGHNKDTPSSSQKALFSTLAFAAKYESALKLDRSIVAPSVSMEANKEIRNVSHSGDSQNKSMKASTILGFLYSSGGKSK